MTAPNHADLYTPGHESAAASGSLSWPVRTTVIIGSAVFTFGVLFGGYWALVATGKAFL